jgi:predicted DNA-binding protein YlxM (UPF0122 family)
MPQYLSVPEFAKLNGISTQAVYQRIARKTLKTKKINVKQLRVVVSEDDVKGNS